MKGFKDPVGKFHPTKNNNGVRKKGGKSIITSGIKLPSLRKQRETTKNMPYEVMNGIMQDFNTTRISISSYNPKWKLYDVYTDDARFYIFPDEDSAIRFGRQSIRDTATEYIPDKESPEYDEWKDLNEDELVEKIIEEQSEFGQSSELGAIAKSVAGYDGQYHELPQGWIAFKIE